MDGHRGRGVSLFPNIVLFYLNIATHSVGYFIFMTFVFSDLGAHGVSSDTAGLVVSLIGGVSIVGKCYLKVLWSYNLDACI